MDNPRKFLQDHLDRRHAEEQAIGVKLKTAAELEDTYLIKFRNIIKEEFKSRGTSSKSEPKRYTLVVDHLQMRRWRNSRTWSQM
jgi:hypothetical protein